MSGPQYVVSGRQDVARLIEQGIFLLEALHNEYKKDPISRETEFWCGNLASAVRTGVPGDEAHVHLNGGITGAARRSFTITGP